MEGSLILRLGTWTGAEGDMRRAMKGRSRRESSHVQGMAAKNQMVTPQAKERQKMESASKGAFLKGSKDRGAGVRSKIYSPARTMGIKVAKLRGVMSMLRSCTAIMFSLNKYVTTNATSAVVPGTGNTPQDTPAAIDSEIFSTVAPDLRTATKGTTTLS